MSLPINIGTWAFFAIALTSLLLGWFVFARNRSGAINRAWFRLSAAVGVWSLATAFMVHSPAIDWAWVWARLAQAALSLIPALFLQFNLTLLNGSSEGKYDNLSRWISRIGGLFALLSLTPLIIRELHPEIWFRYYPVAGPFYGLFLVCLIYF